jgi:hypothetical protein
MLKPIHHVACSPALVACQRLMQRFALWLCNPGTTAASLSHATLQPPVMPSGIEADWLWGFLNRIEGGQPLLDRALALVAMPANQRAALSVWVQSVSTLALQFQTAPPAWPVPRPLADKAQWVAFKTLMEAFYYKAFRAGLPYAADGTPVAAGGVTYAEFIGAFRDAHRLSPDPYAREVCILCGGPLGDTPHVDHWVIKSTFPLLSMCGENLALVCSICNEAPNKGEKPVHSGGSFADWFHPYLRPGSGALQLAYDLHTAAVHCRAVALADQPKATNLDRLLNLGSRWTREFKAEYAKHQDILRRNEARRIKTGQARHTLQDLSAHVHHWTASLSPSEPHHEVHTVLGQAMSEPARMHAWFAELALVQ